MLKTIFLLCSYLYVVFAKHELYDGHSLYEITVDDIEQAKLVNELDDEIGIDVWTHALPGRPGQVLVAEDKKDGFQKILDDLDVKYKIDVKNIKTALELEDELFAAVRMKNNGTRSSSFPFDDIHRYKVIDDYLEELGRVYPQTVTVVTGGKSFEGRDIKYLKISSSNFQNPRKPVVMMQSLLHSREWVSLPVTLYAIHKLVVDVTERDLLQNMDWIILPIANPDGFEFTHARSRFWRKNRATGYSIANRCVGVDLNRNFDMLWGSASSNSACSDAFHGRRAFSEPETAVIRDIMAEHKDRLELFLDIHGVGSYVLYGFGNGVLPSNGLLVHHYGIMMAETIDRVKWTSNKDYVVGNVNLVMYAASGSAQDYAQDNDVPYSYTIELPSYRNTASGNNNRFLVDPQFIPQVGYETWEGIKAVARSITTSFELKHGNVTKL